MTDKIPTATDEQWERVGEPIPLRRPPLITDEQFNKAWRAMRATNSEEASFDTEPVTRRDLLLVDARRSAKETRQ